MGGALSSGVRPGLHRRKRTTCSADDPGSDGPPQTPKVWLSVSTHQQNSPSCASDPGVGNIFSCESQVYKLQTLIPTEESAKDQRYPEVGR